MTRSGGNNDVQAVLLLAVLLVLCAAATWTTTTALPTTNETTTTTRSLSADFHAVSCPQMQGIVRTAVQAAREQDVQLTAGLLRIFFHDCFPQGCDASLLLDKNQAGSEQNEPPNNGLNQRALQLIESIRDTVHKRCGPLSVSCADILAVATSYAVELAGGPIIKMQLGHLDSVEPAQQWQVGRFLPRPDADVNTLLSIFGEKGFFDPVELVALSGAHTVGKARCSSFGDRTKSPNPSDGFAQHLARFCGGDGNRQQNLDVITPDLFDNSYFVDLIKGQGVLTTDQGLANHDRTAWIVKVFANDQRNFFEKFARAMEKMSRLTGSAGGVPARRNCLKRDAVVVVGGVVNLQTTVAAAAAADDDEGLAAASA